jgi:hypothetical protein
MCGVVGGSEARIRFLVIVVSRRIGVLEGCSTERGGRGGGQIGKGARADGREERRAIGRSLLAVDSTDGKAEHLRLQTSHERTLGAAAGEEHVLRRQPELSKNRDGVAERETHALDDGAREMRTRVR